MKVEITNREKNPLLFREEVVLSIGDSKTTPSKKELRQKIAALLSKNEDTIFIKHIRHNYGSSDISCSARAYDSAEKAKDIEKEYIINRNLGVKKKGETAKEAPQPPPAKEEKPADEARDAEEKPAEAAEEKPADEKKEESEEKKEE